MQGHPVLQAGFIAYEQGLKAVEPGVEALNGQPAAVEFRVQGRVIVGLPVGRAAVAWDVGLNAAPRTRLAQGGDVEGFVGIEEEAVQAQLGGFEQAAQLGKDPLQLERIVLVAGLGRRHSQR